MRLEDYWKKRDFEKTKEPKGGDKKSAGNMYVIQKHQARRLHYDLRLEMDGVLKSWALPKTPPAEKGVKRLAVQVEDHPIAYAGFEGTIPEGQYGAGTVEIWDKGQYILKERRAQNKLVFEIMGKKLKGNYCLLRFKGEKNWLFFKKK
ncbi:MAG: 3'-phosphoesterase [Candidatus Bathyarchaeota archaeon]|nr:MAG: 3'-phosphoesterase [Candidatus Bathyarchaeota archaeon]